MPVKLFKTREVAYQISPLEIPDSHPCPFCLCVQGEGECSIIHREDKIMSIVDYRPVERGHVLVISTDHYASALDIPPAIAMRAFAHATELAAAAVQTLGEKMGLFNPRGRLTLSPDECEAVAKTLRSALDRTKQA